MTVKAPTLADEWYVPRGWRRNFRVHVDLTEQFLGKRRQDYAAKIRRMGFTDVCDCDFRDTDNLKNKQRRAGSGEPGQHECTVCGLLCWPHTQIYECDECCEYTLANKYPLPKDEPFYCDSCN